MHIPTQKRMFRKRAFYPSQLPLQHLVLHILNRLAIFHPQFFTGSVKTSFKDPTPPGGGGPLPNSNSSKNLTSLIPKPQSEAKKIDVISRIVFPASFLAFNVMYWSYYLTRNVKVK